MLEWSKVKYLSQDNKTKRLIDAITSKNGYRQKIGLIILTQWLPYPKSRDAIASKKTHPTNPTINNFPFQSLPNLLCFFHSFHHQIHLFSQRFCKIIQFFSSLTSEVIISLTESETNLSWTNLQEVIIILIFNWHIKSSF